MMPKYLIEYDIGLGPQQLERSVIEAETENEARMAAYEAWRQAAEDNAEYDAKLLTRELAEEHGFEDELDDEESEDA